MIKISKIIVFFAIFENIDASIYLFIMIDMTLMFIDFEIVNASFSTLMISFVKFAKLNDFFKFFKNFVVFNLNVKLFNFKANSLEDVYKKVFIIIDIKCLFKCYSLTWLIRSIFFIR